MPAARTSRVAESFAPQVTRSSHKTAVPTKARPASDCIEAGAAVAQAVKMPTAKTTGDVNLYKPRGAVLEAAWSVVGALHETCSPALTRSTHNAHGADSADRSWGCLTDGKRPGGTVARNLVSCSV